MGRPSLREARRAEILTALTRVLAAHGVEGATIARVAAEAGFAPGLLHHHFRSKDEMIEALLAELVAGFRARTRAHDERDRVLAYGLSALSLGKGSDPTAARAWVGVLAEALRTPALFARVRRMLDAEVESLRERSGWTFSEADASAILAFILGALVFGAFAPKKTTGFAAPALAKLISALRRA
jgi:TetR/AcrR family transcriptional repressor of bet genes